MKPVSNVLRMRIDLVRDGLMIILKIEVIPVNLVIWCPPRKTEVKLGFFERFPWRVKGENFENYNFLSDFDHYLIGEGSHERTYEK